MTNLQNQLDKIKQDRIEDLKMTIRVCEHAVAYEPLSIGCQELIVKHIKYCEMIIKKMEMQLNASALAKEIYSICSPSNIESHV